MARKVALTAACIEALKKGSLSDPLTPGLTIEVLGSGKKRWPYRRQVAGTKAIATMFGGVFPGQSIADARDWARRLNEGSASRGGARGKGARGDDRRLRPQPYMAAVREGHSSLKQQFEWRRSGREQVGGFGYWVG